jgi:hypothetical protein
MMRGNHTVPCPANHPPSARRVGDRCGRIGRMACSALSIAIAAWPCSAQQQDRAAPVDAVAYVNTKVALVRSGAGYDHYPTDALLLGDAVQIVERQDEWVGIRPPEESFCWVAATSLRLVNERDATVIHDDVKAWLGSQVTEFAQHTFHIQMRRGERVQIAGQKEVTDASGKAATWVRVRPPVGEVRWLRAAELSDTPPTIPAGRAASAVPAEGWVDRHPSASRGNVLDRPLPAERAATRGQRASAISAHETTGSFEDRLARLQLALSRAAAQAAEQQEWATLEQETQALLQAGSSPFERGRAHRLLESVQAFRELAAEKGHAGESSDPSAADENRDVDDSAGDAQDQPIGSGIAEQSPYAAKGWLVAVSAPAGMAPPYAVVDRDGRPQAFLSPAPGVNLRRYLDHEVGVIGKESFDVVLKEKHHRHVVAHQVIELARHRTAADTPWKFTIPWIRMRDKLADEMSSLTARD